MAFDSGKHPRGKDGRFGQTAASDLVGAQKLAKGGVAGSHKIKVKSSRVRKYNGHETVDDYVKSHKRGKATALRELAADFEAGRIEFEAQEAVTTFVAPDRSTLSVVHKDFQKGDYLISLNNSKKYPPGMTIGDYLKSHPKGEKVAASTIAADVKNGRLQIERPKSLMPKIVRKPPAAVVERGHVAASGLVNYGKGVNQDFKKDIEAGVAKIPGGVKDLLKIHGIQMHAPVKLTDTAPELAGKQPRGWPEGSTWEQVDGVYQGGAKKIVCAQTYIDKFSGKTIQSLRSTAVILHETGHGFDHAIGYGSSAEAFRSAYSKDVKNFVSKGGKMDDPAFAYFLQPEEAGRSEMFAEMFADRLGHSVLNKKNSLSLAFPECASHMDRLLKMHGGRG